MIIRDNLGRYLKGTVFTNRNKRVLVCEDCGKCFSGNHLRKYCSVECWNKHRSDALSKGWNSEKRRSYFSTPEYIKNQKNACGSNEKHRFWKGDDAGYTAIHEWIRRNIGKADHCSFNPNHKSTRYHWANISGNYMRDADDYASLCPSCHRTYDLLVKKINTKRSRKLPVIESL